MSIWEENLSFLQSTAGRIHRKMVNASDDTGMSVFVDTKKSLVRVKTDDVDIYLGSTINYQRESERLFASCDEYAGLVILLGVGNLHLLSEIKRKFKELKHFIIVEPSVTIFNEIMRNISIKKVFASFPNTDISIILDEEFEHVNMFYRNFTSSYAAETVAVVTPVGYSRLFPIYRMKLNEFVAKETEEKSTTQFTRRFFRHMWHINEWRNLHIETAKVHSLAEMFNKTPVIIVSAGPSLNKNMHLLKEVGNRAVIIAVGSAIRVLHKNGIIPHFRMSIEATSVQDRLFEGINPSEAPLLYSSHIYHETLQKYKDNSVEIFLYKSHRLEQYMFERVGIADFNSISSGSSVANIAVFLAGTYSCPKIIMVGQDLCSQLNKHYAEGSWTSEKENAKLFEYANKVITQNIYGQTVVSTDILMNIKSTLEYAATVHFKSLFINATEGGLNIEGYENKSLAAVLQDDLLPQEEIDIREHIQSAIKTYKENPLFSKDLKHKIFTQYRKDLTELKKAVKKLERAVQEGVENKHLKTLKKLCEDIYQIKLYENIVGNGFVPTVLDVKKGLVHNDIDERRYFLTEFVDSLLEFIDLSDDLAEEFLTDQIKMKFVFQQ